MIPSGYEQSLDYGDPEPTVRGFVITAILIVAAIVLLVNAAL